MSQEIPKTVEQFPILREECECPKCGEKFKWRRQRNRHMWKRHIDILF
jgi:predicted RNA-binding Zn-ribbon protein involved in translation (DUF1610 family)